MTSWLRAQRKSELLDLAEDAGLTDLEGLRKDELSAVLEDHLRANATRLSKKPSLAPFFERTASPAKRDVPGTNSVKPSSELQNTAGRAYRRVTKAKEEIENTISEITSPENIRQVISRTPARIQHAGAQIQNAAQTAASQIPLPPSPATISNAVEHQTARLSNRLATIWKDTELAQNINALREALSSVTGIQTALLLLEYYGLQRETLPWSYAFSTPWVRLPWMTSGNLINSHPVYIPNLFLLLTSSFWAPTLLWLTTSLFLPLLFGYFFNLTLRSKRAPHRGPGRPPTRASSGKPSTVYKVDPLTFNVAKLLVTWLVYAKKVSLRRWPGAFTVARVDYALLGGWEGVVLGCLVGAVMSLYEAVLKH